MSPQDKIQALAQRRAALAIDLQYYQRKTADLELCIRALDRQVAELEAAEKGGLNV